jgi:hypothetical protein
VRIFKSKWFAHFARKEHIIDATLVDAIRDVESGLIDGDLGAGLIKKRIALEGGGKRSGYRTIIVHKEGSCSVFVYGFKKNRRANLSQVELDVYRKLAKIYLGLSDADIAKAQKEGEIEEVKINEKEISK